MQNTGFFNTVKDMLHFFHLSGSLELSWITLNLEFLIKTILTVIIFKGGKWGEKEQGKERVAGQEGRQKGG